jgi:hypothetical protein
MMQEAMQVKDTVWFGRYQSQADKPPAGND